MSYFEGKAKFFTNGIKIECGNEPIDYSGVPIPQLSFPLPRVLVAYAEMVRKHYQIGPIVWRALGASAKVALSDQFDQHYPDAWKECRKQVR